MATRIDFGEDEYQHACGGAFEDQAQGRFSGLDFSPDGFSWDALDADGTESWIVCTKCRARFAFGEWQDRRGGPGGGTGVAEGAAVAVKYRIVMSSEIARCPQHRLDPRHWIPRHKTEQCGGKQAWRKKRQRRG